MNMDQKKTAFYDPLPYGYAFKVPRVMGAISYCCSVAEARDAVEHDTRNDYDWRAVCEYMDRYGIIPDWLETRMAEASRHAKPWHKYVVTHLGAEHLVVARSESEAVSSFRYKKYGTRRTEDCPPFSVRLYEGDTGGKASPITREDVAKRLKALALARDSKR